MSPDPLEGFDRFVSTVRARLEAGRITYGDRSFLKPPDALLEEVAQEALDLAGWGYILWVRLEAMRAELDEQKRLHAFARDEHPDPPPSSASGLWTFTPDGGR